MKTIMKNMNSRALKRFDEMYENTSIHSADGINKKMNREGYSITVKAVRYLLKKKKKEMNEFITDRDETDNNHDDDDYTEGEEDEEEEEVTGKVIEDGTNVHIPPGISIFLKPPSVPQA